MIDVIGSPGGNIGSLTRCLSRLELSHRVITRPAEHTESAPVILPGVGAFGGVARALSQDGWYDALPRLLLSKTPLLGICVGLQILFSESDESPGVPGLKVLPGRISRFQAAKVPQVGWNGITASGNNLYPSGFAYFVNSYYVVPDRETTVLYTSDFHGPFCAGVHSDNITAFQFHPEVSGAFGRRVLRVWFDAL